MAAAKNASPIGTILNILNTLLGAGILGIPNTFSLGGLIPTIAVMFTVAILTYISCKIMIQLAYDTNSKELGEIASKLIGNTAGKLLSFLISLFCLFSMSAFLVVAADTVQHVAGFIELSKYKRTILVILTGLSVPVPLTIAKDISAFYSISTITVIFIVFYIFAIIYEFVIKFNKIGISPTFSFSSLNSSLFSIFSVHTMAFALPIILLPLFDGYHEETRLRNKLVSITLLVNLAFVLVPSVFNYLMFGRDCAENILNSFDSRDILVNIIRLLFFFIVAFSYPIVCHCAVSSLSNLFFGTTTEPDNKRRSIPLLLMNFLAITLACSLPNIRPALSFGGAIGGCLVDFFYPAILWIIHSNEHHILCYFLAAFGVITAAVSMTKAIADLI